jgi:hypothetical protein
MGTLLEDDIDNMVKLPILTSIDAKILTLL